MREILSSAEWLVWVGYLASGIIALSMTMNSIVKFRIINLLGASLFSAYGFVIGAYPVGILNAFIVSVDIYYLIRIFGRSESFELLEVRPDNKYMLRFLEFHGSDILKFFPAFAHDPLKDDVHYLVLRNMSVAGLLIGHTSAGAALTVKLDYVIPAYRDFKSGRFVYHQLGLLLHEKGINRLLATEVGPRHLSYLLKNGFSVVADGQLEKKIG